LRGIPDVDVPPEDTARVFAAVEAISAGGAPRSHEDAMSRLAPENQRWRQGEIEEVLSHIKNDTLGPEQELPAGFKAIPLAWVYRYKEATDRYKARIILKGYLQRFGDYNETFAPVARSDSVRIAVAIAVARGWNVLVLDVATAYLAAEVDAEVYVTVPPGFSTEPLGAAAATTNFKKHKAAQRFRRGVRRLKKAIPGVKQGAYLWNVKAHAELLRAGFVRVADDHCLYYHGTLRAIVVLWVDDLLIVYPKEAQSGLEDAVVQLQVGAAAAFTGGRLVVVVKLKCTTSLG
jgi:hypothetical protein